MCNRYYIYVSVCITAKENYSSAVRIAGLTELKIVLNLSQLTNRCRCAFRSAVNIISAVLSFKFNAISK